MDKREQGFGLIEQVIAISIFLLIMAAAMSVLISIQKAENHAQLRNSNNNQARTAMTYIGRQIRSANYIYNPATLPNPYMDLVIYTQANGNFQCVQWEIRSNTLETRTWSPVGSPASTVTPWSPIATHILNADSSTPTPAFTLNTSNPYYGSAATGYRLLSIDFIVNKSTNPASAVTLQNSYTGLNVEYGFPSNSCSVLP